MVSAGVRYQDEDANSEGELDEAEDIETFRIGENRHCGRGEYSCDGQEMVDASLRCGGSLWREGDIA